MMKLNEFLDKLELAYKTPNYYLTGGWGKWNGAKWGWDCVCLIKGILWGWNDDRTKLRGGGAVYASNGVPDIGTEQMINVCKNVSTDFSTLQVGEMVWMQGHVGVCIAKGKIIECTAGWATWKIIKSDIDAKGNRTYNGNGLSAPWVKHGFLPYVDYSSAKPEPKPEPEVNPLDKYSDEELANMVIDGKFGNNPERKEKLGKRYDAVQALVNAMMITPVEEEKAEELIAIQPGDKVNVWGKGKAASDGTGASTKTFKNVSMKVIAINEGAEYPYALNQYCEGEVGDYSAVTAWFKESDVERM